MAPAPPTPPTGKYEHEKLFVRAIVIDNGATRAALINVDGAAPASGRAKAADELKCPVENVIISSTHSHSASLGGPPPGTRGFAPRPQQGPSPLDSVVVEAVRQAVSKLQPARMGFGTGRSYLNVNRDAINPTTHLWTQDANPTAPSDKTVAVLKFETPAGDPIAFYMNYAMHPVNLYLGGILSADYPGAASRYIEQVYDDKMVAVFSQGAEGDQNPLYLRAAGAAQLERGGQKYTGQPLVKEQVEAEIREGRRKMVPLDAKAAEAIEKWIDAEGLVFAEEVLRVAQATPAKAGQVRIAGVQKTLTCLGRTRTNEGREGQPGTYEDGPDVNLLIGMVGIGDVGLVSINAEVYSQIGQIVKAKSPMANTVFVGMANGSANSGYVPTDDAYGHNTFQVLGARLKSGCAETGIPNAMVDLLTQYAAPMAGTK
ncbi:MAG: neutral/alkaline non-lysosomal ceramidase N-terminal domain-containing protein [Candidatus Solibacter sp.]|nr:neutral/alkaline non-lysosomal ceramidase N-terminal domain-containing protein [Candidatus Solibacter sp.]